MVGSFCDLCEIGPMEVCCGWSDYGDEIKGRDDASTGRYALRSYVDRIWIAAA